MTVNEVRSLLGREDESGNAYGSGYLTFMGAGVSIGVENVLDDEITGNERVVYQRVWDPQNLGNGYNTCLTMNELRTLVRRDQNVDVDINDEAGEGFTNDTDVVIGNYRLFWYWDERYSDEKSVCMEIWEKTDVVSLSAPIIGAWKSDNSKMDEARGLNVSWSNVDGAYKYEYKIYMIAGTAEGNLFLIDDGVTTSNNVSFYFQDIVDGFSISVRAVGEKNGQTLYSDWGSGDISASEAYKLSDEHVWKIEPQASTTGNLTIVKDDK